MQRETADRLSGKILIGEPHPGDIVVVLASSGAFQDQVTVCAGTLVITSFAMTSVPALLSA
jgi:hypothetical protein